MPSWSMRATHDHFMIYGSEKYGHVLSGSLYAGLLGAVAALRAALRARGSDLLLRIGPAAAEVPATANLLGAGRIVAEEEVEHR